MLISETEKKPFMDRPSPKPLSLVSIYPMMDRLPSRAQVTTRFCASFSLVESTTFGMKRIPPAQTKLAVQLSCDFPVTVAIPIRHRTLSDVHSQPKVPPSL